MQIEPPFQPLLRALERDSFDRVMNGWAIRAQTKARTIVRRIPLLPNGKADGVALPGPLEVFFKEYRFNRPSWRFWLRRSKARVEFENYGRLSALNLQVAQRIAGGERRDWLGRVSSAWIVTLAVPNSQTLIEFLSQTKVPVERRAALDTLAEMVAGMHRACFFYYDLFGRNVLVSREMEGPRPVLIDCPRGRQHRFSRRRHSLRDLASLDKDARHLCRRTERLRFLLRYLGKQRLDADAKQIVHACLRYSLKRWPN